MAFDVIKAFKSNVIAAAKKLPDHTKTALKANTQQIEDLNREQLKKGLRSDNQFLPNYSKKSVEVYGKPAGPIKLFDTGDFYRGIKPEFGSQAFELKGFDSKTAYLTTGEGSEIDFLGYGEEILGLTEENLKDVALDSLGHIQYLLRQTLQE